MKTKSKFFNKSLGLLLFFLASQSGHCFYNPTTGKWLSRDPLPKREDGNVYVFAINEPLAHFDKLGLECCLLTWPASSSGGTSIAGHSALSCDDGSYVSLWPVSKDGPWHTNEVQDINWENGRPPQSLCFKCLNQSQVKNWLDQAQQSGTQWCLGNNCADAVGGAIAASLPSPQVKPTCPCDPDRFNHWTVEDLLTPSAAISLPSGLKQRVQNLTNNNCNRYKCVLKNIHTGTNAN